MKCATLSRGGLAATTLNQFWIETRIIGCRVELHAAHGRSGERFISSADRFEDAAEGLVELIERTSHGGAGNQPDAWGRARFAAILSRAATRVARSIRSPHSWGRAEA
jgi:hypothetical protein